MRPTIVGMNYINRSSVAEHIFCELHKELLGLGMAPADGKIACPICFKPLSLRDVTIEHIIPERALGHDPIELQSHHLSNRAGITLLCGDCNRLKGCWYDPMIEKLFMMPRPNIREKIQHRMLKAERTLGYLAAFRELGYTYIFSKSLNGIRCDFLNPIKKPDATGINFIANCFVRDHPHEYFDGWCDTFDAEGTRINSVFSYHRTPGYDTMQVRARHITVMMPVGKVPVVVPRKPNEGYRWHIDVSHV